MELNNIRFFKDNKLQYGNIKFSSHIEEIYTENTINSNSDILIPAYVDIHCHGGFGYDVMSCNTEDFCNLGKNLLNTGTGLYMPTLVGADFDSIEKITETIAAAKEKKQGAQIIGVHIEGTFISPQKSGIMDKKYIYPANIQLVDRLLQYGLKLRFTVAPEISDAMEFIEYAVQKGCYISLGHSCCSGNEAKLAIKKGANSITHLFNAMLPLDHREPKLVGIGLTSDVYCEVICDTYHISEDILSLIYKAKGSYKGIIISDGISAMGMEDGIYSFCGKDIYVRNGKATDINGRLAGSICCMHNGVKNMLKISKNPVDIIKWAVINPARAVGIENHIIEKGNNPPLLLLDSNFNIKQMFTLTP